MISIDEYLHTSFRPACDFVGGEVRERNVGMRRHSYPQGEIVSWFNQRKKTLRLQSLPELRMRVSPSRVRIPDVVVSEMPLPDEEVFTSPPCLCIEVMSPNGTFAACRNVSTTI
jgi:Uma2 family endonuclease